MSQIVIVRDIGLEQRCRGGGRGVPLLPLLPREPAPIDAGVGAGVMTPDVPFEGRRFLRSRRSLTAVGIAS
jgi:hypothetical protein